MATGIRRVLLVGAPLVLAVVLWWHPPGAENVYEGVRDDDRNAILTDPSLSLIVGTLGWITAMIAAAAAFRHEGAGWPVTLVIGFAALFAIHPPPIGPLGLVCFAAGVVLVERRRARAATAITPPSAASPI